jgi:hypothetical protein
MRLVYNGNQSHNYCAITNFDASTVTFIPAAHVASNTDPDTLTYDEAKWLILLTKSNGKSCK